MKTVCNKLVRDRIPEIIEQKGGSATTRVLAYTEFVQFARKKLQEEVAESLDSQETEELVDLLEIIYAIASSQGITPEELEQRRINKQSDRGSFQQKVLLISAEQ